MLERVRAAVERILANTDFNDPSRELLADYLEGLRKPPDSPGLLYLQESGATAALPYLEEAGRTEDGEKRRELISLAMEALSQAE